MFGLGVDCWCDIYWYLFDSSYWLGDVIDWVGGIGYWLFVYCVFGMFGCL